MEELAPIPQEYLSSYIHTYIYVFADNGKKYGGLFEGFDNQNNLYMKECVEIEKYLTNAFEYKKKVTHHDIHLICISDILAVYSRDLPSPEVINQTLPQDKAFKPRSFCRSTFCESLATGVSPLGGYVGPDRGAGRHIQSQPFCNCSYPPQTTGPQTVTPIPMALRTYSYEHYDPRYN